MKRLLFVIVISLPTIAMSQNSYPSTGITSLNSGTDQTLILKDGRSGTNWNYMEWQFSNGTRDWVLGRRVTTGYFTLWRNGINEVFTADNAGNIGIGTTDPTGKLDVRGGIVAKYPSGNQLSIQSNAWRWDFDVDEGSGNNFRLRNMTSGTVPFVVTTAGNIGIGTSTPSSKLHVDGGHVYIGPLTGTLNGTGRISVSGTYAELSLTNRSVSSFVESPSQGERWVIYNEGTATDGKLRFWTNGDKMVLTKDGNVGIGTTSPTQKLTVNGTIYGKEVKVDLSVPGPDYVFNEDYKLTPLQDIKTYIDQHKHLPEVPSAEEMEKEGIQLGEMNMLLLKKIEELTLYVIELKKEDVISREQMRKMQLRIDQLTKAK